MDRSIMSFIEGVGDEVTVLCGIILLVLALVLAWLSTHVADRSDQIFGTIVTTGNSPLVGLSGVERYVANAAAPEVDETQTATASAEQKPEEEGNSGLGASPGNNGPTSEQLPIEGASNLTESSLDPLLNIQGLRKRTSSGEISTGDGLDQGRLENCNVNTHTVDSSEEGDGQIKVRLKFLNDTEEVARVKPEDTIGFLKSKYFPGQEQQMKLIYQGQLLQDQSRTLGSLNITDNCVIHCHISQTSSSSDPAVSSVVEQNQAALNVGNLMIPVFVIMLAVVWYYRINYRQFFTAPATVSLVGVTVFFSFLVFGIYGR
ncbi:transmembrane and ubiquitin-like domain-containing protein 2 [Callorhinchus milii]|uniref:Transmembrane and ubiquitin-like domain containing 2 n=1 Tax=Callorhinchus milii TaxID=7868 RepID=V9KXJ5_CALMI|nr:transmembrane and ubiquitin-like domain-containing protein 2 [Callorhinchus milii]|eukprot:gi/632966980/ref/XP_007899720.1/ PREDICTED: transmembrane and ubiquitin-like domain-containing protein 2 [Callorhinchus milii]